MRPPPALPLILLATAPPSSGAFPTMAAQPSATTRRKKAVVVGGGPSGLAASLVLSRYPLCYDVTLLETFPDALSSFDVTRAYVFQVNNRSVRSLISHFPDMLSKLERRGVRARYGGFVYVPTDMTSDLPEPASNVGTDEDEGEAGYWIPRHVLVGLMEEVVGEYRPDAELGEGRIRVERGRRCVSLEPVVVDGTSGEEMISVLTERILDGGGGAGVNGREAKGKLEVEEHTAHLVVGADGFRSRVRECLANQRDDDDEAEGEAADSENYVEGDEGPFKKAWGPHFDPSRFRPRKWTSPSTGLRLKALQFPPKFPLTRGDGTTVPSECTTGYIAQSKDRGPRTSCTLGLLPVVSDTMPRPTNVITRPDHDLWTKLRDGPSARKFFTDAFPRMPFESDDLIGPDEWDRFAKAEGTRFPPCQYSPGLVAVGPGGHCGVALVGDALHAFPPDVGQGVNAGLCDVAALGRALRGESVFYDGTVSGGGGGGGEAKSSSETLGNSTALPTLADALAEYERVQGPETRALIRLARFGSPYQYRQPHRIDVFRRYLWTANVILRILLNKLTFGLVPKPAIMLSQVTTLSFRRVMRRADGTTAVLCGMAAWVLGRILLGRLGSRVFG